mmetsp:Transcript_66606/g.145209  ORF Transcript_66606/g.145209 Transcript_66606/m.145209 type:complete len:350 (-) Transcript_66606:2019-3068(-)
MRRSAEGARQVETPVADARPEPLGCLMGRVGQDFHGAPQVQFLVVVLCISGEVLEVEAELFVFAQEMFLASYEEVAGWMVIMQVLRAQTMHWICRKPAGRNRLRATPVRNRSRDNLLLAKDRYDENEDNRVEEHVEDECRRALQQQLVTFPAMLALLAICLEDGAAQQQADRNAKHPLSPPVYAHGGEVAAGHAAQYFVVVIGVDEHVGEGERQEESRRESAGKVEYQHDKHNVHQDVGIPRQIHVCAPHEGLHLISRNLRVASNDERHDLVRHVDRRERLDDEGNQKCGWEGVSRKIDPQLTLHSVGFKALGEGLEVGERNPAVGPHVDPLHHLIHHEVCHAQVQQDI